MFHVLGVENLRAGLYIHLNSHITFGLNKTSWIFTIRHRTLKTYLQNQSFLRGSDTKNPSNFLLWFTGLSLKLKCLKELEHCHGIWWNVHTFKVTTYMCCLINGKPGLCILLECWNQANFWSLNNTQLWEIWDPKHKGSHLSRLKLCIYQQKKRQ